jgi:membrane associated rhomboid family serine protease
MPVTRHLLAINVIVWLATVVLQQVNMIDLNRWLGLHFWLGSNFNPAQLFTYMFMHANFTHLFSNMFSLYMFGRLLEMVWGARRFLIYYLVCGVGAALVQQLTWRWGMHDAMAGALMYANPSVPADQISAMSYAELLNYCEAYVNNYITVGASGSVFGILLAFGMMFPNATIFLLFPPMPLKAKWLVIGYGVFELFCGVANTAGDNVAHFAHLGGMLFGFILIMLWKHDKRTTF